MTKREIKAIAARVQEAETQLNKAECLIGALPNLFKFQGFDTTPHASYAHGGEIFFTFEADEIIHELPINEALEDYIKQGYISPADFGIR
nr:MAG TPA: hypothetical protein [Caudoviricetes sp.]